MTDQSPPQPPVEPTPAPAPPAYAPAPAPATPTVPWRERVLGLRAVVAVAVASLLLGGLAGAALGAVSDGPDGRDGRMGPGMMRQFPGQQGQGGPGSLQVPAPGGNLPPSTAPDDDETP